MWGKSGIGRLPSAQGICNRWISILANETVLSTRSHQSCCNKRPTKELHMDNYTLKKWCDRIQNRKNMNGLGHALEVVL